MFTVICILLLAVLVLPTIYSAIVLGVNNLSMLGLTKLFYFWNRLGRAAFDEPGDGIRTFIFNIFSYTVFWPLDYAYRNMIGAPQYMVGMKHELMSELVDRYLRENVALTQDVRQLCKKHNVTPKHVMRTSLSLGYFDVITDPQKGHEPHFGDPELYK